MKQLPLTLAEACPPSFDNFVVGANAAALECLRHGAGAVAVPAPVYLWGPSGSGKTHLLQALAATLSGSAVAWVDARHGARREPGAALLVIDDCDRLDAERQQLAFASFVDAAAHGARVVAAGRLPPVDLALRDDLRSRLGWGPVFALAPLTEAEARAALQREAARRGIALGDDVMDYLLARLQRDMKHLMTLLDRLDDFALAQQRAVTVPLVRRMLQETLPQATPEPGPVAATGKSHAA